MRLFHYSRPRDVAEAVTLLSAEPDARVVAGGTDLVTLVRDGVRAPSHLVDIGGLPLDEAEWLPDGGVRIGALHPNAPLDSALRERYPLLAQALASGASPQIRNMATFGGNLLQGVRCPYFRLPEYACNRRDPGSGCAALDGDSSHHAVLGTSSRCVAVHPSDLAVALQALDATVRLVGRGGRRRGIPIDELHRLPGNTPHREHALRHGELIESVELPAQPKGRRSHYLKFRDRASFAFALVSVAAVLDVRGGTVRHARVALGGVAPKPWRSRAAERELTGARLTDAAVTAAAEAAAAEARPQPDNAYKVELLRRCVRRALTEAGGR
ncbi:xanthine dehydrogenase family protein subunit M [Streptomyces sp. JJ38]|uniref:FAD binding domain-containing protein n=1 Tax=Streptomyces sp. JJ38 TaxID=2738128 RepID=UPI001C571AAB|nr:xanthine dehydrogenase family protein subunit M [Streptomyces sp. JJ38]